MQRIPCPERDDWRATAESVGFTFHTIDGERYWDERAYYAFTLNEIERRIEAPTGEIEAMCLELVGRAINDEKYLRRLKIPEAFWPLLSESWRRHDASLYGRLDLSYDGWSPAKLLEYNADTPTSIFEAAVFQWTWLEQAMERNIIPKRADQFNSIHERLIDAWKKHGGAKHLHLAGMTDNDRGCRHAGLSAGHREPGRIADHADGHQGRRTAAAMAASSISTTAASSSPSSSTPGNGCFTTRSAQSCRARRHAGSSRPGKRSFPTRAFLPLLWEMFPKHPNLLPAYFEDDPKAAMLGSSFVRKPLYSREGANVALVSAGTTLMEQQGPYGAEGFIRQAFAPLPSFSDQYAVVGSWLVDHTPCGLSIREDENPITGNTSRFLPHAIVVARLAGRRGEDQAQRAAATARRVCGTRVDAPTRITGAMFGR